jgi:cardiolipin synthase (CMP-forming)
MNNSERSTLRRPAWRTIPNLFTAVRFALVAPIVALLLSGAQPLGAAALAAVFGATDWIDGWLARRLRQVSHLGTILDPLADRLGIACIATALASVEAVPWWVIAVFPAVDLLVFGVFVIHRERSLTVTRTGKVRTGVAMVSVLVVIIGMAPGLDLVLAVGQAGLALGAALHAAVGVDYLRQLLGPSAPVSHCGPEERLP